jgi:rod shape-determining protein MreB
MPADAPSPNRQAVKRVGDLAIDLGTANTLVYQEGKGIVYDEPSVIAMDAREGDVLAIGEEAWEMIGRTPSRIVAVRPLRRGAITDYDVTSQMIRLIFKRVGVTRFARPKALVCVPSAITEVERRAVRDAATSAGARAVSLIEEPMAAAIGAGLPVHEPLGNLVVDVGGGTSEVAMVSMGGIIARSSLRIGGFDMDEVVQRYLRREYGVAIGERAAEMVKIAAGSAYPVTGVASARIKGREIATGMPKEIEITPEELRDVLAEPVVAVVNATKQCLGESDPELGQDVLERGMFLTGGGSLLRGLDTLLAHECEVPVHLTESPLQTVVLGAGKCLELMTQEAGLFGGSPWLR